MFEKDMKLTLLLDCYGELLGEHKRDIFEMYYCEDLSLAEIAENTGISRQGVRDSIKKSENELRMFESKLHLVERISVLRKNCLKVAESLESIARGDAASAQTLLNAAVFLKNINV